MSSYKCSRAVAMTTCLMAPRFAVFGICVDIESAFFKYIDKEKKIIYSI